MKITFEAPSGLASSYIITLIPQDGSSSTSIKVSRFLHRLFLINLSSKSFINSSDPLRASFDVSDDVIDAKYYVIIETLQGNLSATSDLFNVENGDFVFKWNQFQRNYFKSSSTASKLLGLKAKLINGTSVQAKWMTIKQATSFTFIIFKRYEIFQI